MFFQYISYGRFRGDKHDAPCLNIKIMNPTTNMGVSVQGIIDSGSDITLIPINVLEGIEVEPAGDSKNFAGASGALYSRPFVVALEFNNKIYDEIEIWGWEMDFALIGRDMLSTCRIELDGKRQRFSIKF